MYRYKGVINLGDGPVAEFESDEPITRVMGKEVRSFRLNKESFINRIKTREAQKFDVSEELKALSALEQLGSRKIDSELQGVSPVIFHDEISDLFSMEDDAGYFQKETTFRVASD